ncbi:MAG: MliC family protein [Oceanicoccus sp.]
MKIFVPLTCVSILLVSACASSGKNNVDTQTPVAGPSSVYTYQCDSGETIFTSYSSTNSATIQYKGSHYNMQIAASGSGSRYVDKKLEWWTKGSGYGSEGTLFHHLADGSSGASIERCIQS